MHGKFLWKKKTKNKYTWSIHNVFPSIDRCLPKTRKSRLNFFSSIRGLKKICLQECLKLGKPCLCTENRGIQPILAGIHLLSAVGLISHVPSRKARHSSKTLHLIILSKVIFSTAIVLMVGGRVEKWRGQGQKKSAIKFVGRGLHLALDECKKEPTSWWKGTAD